MKNATRNFVMEMSVFSLLMYNELAILCERSRLLIRTFSEMNTVQNGSIQTYAALLQ